MDTHDALLLRWWTDGRVLGQPPAQLALALGAALLAYAVMHLGLRLARHRLGRLASHTRTRLDDALVDVLAATQGWLLMLAALLVGVSLLELPERWTNRAGQLWFVAVAVQLALWLNRLVGIALRHHVAQHAAAGTASMSAAATLMSWGARTLVWAVVLLAILSNLGVDITAFVASLGVGGIAVALAVQNILGDLFASLSIAIDKPFEVGDFIVTGSVSGTVEQVGVKTTRIRALGGEQVVMGNTELLKQTISNHKRLQRRRIVFGFGLTYDTPPAALAEVPALVREIVQASPRLQFDRAHFKGFGESTLDVEVVYTVLSAAYDDYMDEQQRINLALLEQLPARGLGFAFPTRTVQWQGAARAGGGAGPLAPAD